MRTPILFLLIALVACGSGAMAQQLETNDAGGTLLINGSATPNGSPAIIPANGNVDVTIQGGDSLPLAFFAGSRASTSFCPPALSGECLDLDMSAPLYEIANGFTGSPFGFLNSNGSVLYSIPVHAVPVCDFGFQSIVSDPGIPPIFVNLTAAGMIQTGGAGMQFAGDDSFQSYDFCSPVNVFGNAYSRMYISTNGWIKFGGVPVFSDLTESNADFLSGNVGGSGSNTGPVIAGLWDDLNMTGNADNSFVIVTPISSTLTRITWNNVRYFGSSQNIGTFFVHVSSDGTIDKDYSGMNLLNPATRGLVGISAGDTSCQGAVQPLNLFSGGSYSSSAAGNFLNCQGYSQNFNPGNPFSETFDLGGINSPLVYFVGSAGGYNIL